MQDLMSEKVRLFQLTDQYHVSAILQFANDAKIFDFMKEKHTCSDIAKKFNWIETKTELFLNTLIVLGLIKKDNNFYSNTETSNVFLRTDSSSSISAIIAHQKNQWDNWSNIGEALAASESLPCQQEIRFAKDKNVARAFTTAMQQLSSDNIETILKIEEFKKAKKVIDLAGGHGEYLLKLALKYPQMYGEIWDLEHIRDAAEMNINTFGLDERVKFEAKDITHLEDIREKADVIMLNDCLHYFNQTQIINIFSSLKHVLLKKGVLIILTMNLSENKLEPHESVFFSFNMMLNTLHGQLHPTGWIEKQLENLGYKVSRITVEKSHRYVLLKVQSDGGI